MDTNENNSQEQKTKKQFPLWSLILTGAVCILLAVVLTLQFCYRFMFLDTKNEYERQLSSLSEKLAPPEDKNAFSDLPDKIDKIYDELIEDAYGKLDDQAFEEDLLHEFFLLTGDPFARYMTKDEYRDYYYASRSTSVGIGVTVTKDAEGRAVISHVEKNGPAGKAGIARGDTIIAVDGKLLSETGYEEGLALIKGKEKTDVTLTIGKKSGAQNNIILTRETVKFSGVRAQNVDGTGYLRLLTLGGDTVDEFKSAIDALVAENVRGIVFDLRSTSGGTLSSLHKLLDYLLGDKAEDGSDRYAFKTVDAHKNVREYLLSDNHAVDLPFAILIDGQTEKEGEVFAGALRLLSGAAVFGKTSAGNGTVQSLHVLKDGSAIVYTSGEILFFDDSGLSGGIVPDRDVDDGGINIYLTDTADDPVFRAAADALKHE